jgi:A-macroglobulin TED domain/Alpha-2-macroglobulin family/A-macroglobulin receptor binding domain
MEKVMTAAERARVQFDADMKALDSKFATLDSSRSSFSNVRSSLVRALGSNSRRFRVHVMTDKCVYRPGERVFARGVILSCDDNSLLSANVAGGARDALVELRAKHGNAVVSSGTVKLAQGGIVSAQLTLDESISAGEHVVSVRIDGASVIAGGERDIDVWQFSAPPRLRKQLVFVKKGLGAGDRAVACLSVERAEGGAPKAAKVTAVARIDGAEVYRSEDELTLDSDGKCTIVFELPDTLPADGGDGALSATIADGGTVELVQKTIPILLSKIDVRFYPESGHLVAGLESALYIESFLPSGEPADLDADLVELDSSSGAAAPASSSSSSSPSPSPLPQSTVCSLVTEHEGRGRCVFTPETGKRYALQVFAPSGIDEPIALPACSGVAVVRAERRVYAADAPLDLTVAAANAGRYRLALAKDDRVIAEQLLTFDGNGLVREQTVTFASLPSSAAGVLRATLYAAVDNGAPLAERLVYRQPANRVRVSVASTRAEYAPGDQVGVRFQALDDVTGAPLAGAVCLVSVVDDAALQMVERRKLQPRLRECALLEGVLSRTPLRDAAKYLATAYDRFDQADPVDPELAVDLLLGTQGWRRFIWSWPAGDARLAERDADAKRVLAIGALPPALADAVANRRPARRANRSDLPLSPTAMYERGPVIQLEEELGVAAEPIRKPRKFGFRRRSGVKVTKEVNVLRSGAGDRTRSARKQEKSKKKAARPAPGGRGRGGSLSSSITSASVSSSRAPAAAPAARFQQQPLQAMNMRAAFAPPPKFVGGAPPRIVQSVFADDDDDDESSSSDEVYDEALPSFVAEARRARRDRVRGAVASSSSSSAISFCREFAQPAPPRQLASDGAAPRERSDFTSTVYWRDAAVASAQGMASAQFHLCDSITSFKVFVDVIDPLTGALGGGDCMLSSRQPFEVDVKVPYELSTGDIMKLPIGVVNRGFASVRADVTVSGGSGLRVAADADAEPGAATAECKLTHVVGADARNRVLVHASAGPTPCKSKLRVSAIDGATAGGDSTSKTIKVVGRGFPMTHSASGRLAATSGGRAAEEAHAFTVVDDRIEEAGTRTTALVTFSLGADMASSLRSLIKTPHGCYEQLGATMYPMAMVLQYFTAAGDVDQALLGQLMRQIRDGYKRMLAYHVKGGSGGASWWGRAPAHEALTAFGLLIYTELSSVWQGVSQKVLRDATQFLLSRRDGKGRFEQRAGQYAFARPNRASADAYICWALTEAGITNSLDPELDELMRYYELGKRSGPSDSYVLALLACALNNAGRDADADAVAHTLTLRIGKDGRLRDAVSTITRSGAASRDIEATSLAIIAWLRIDRAKYAEQIDDALRFVNSKRSRGIFSTTQGTALALKALMVRRFADASSSSSSSPSPSAAAPSISLLVDDKVVETIAFTSQREAKFKQFGRLLCNGEQHTVTMSSANINVALSYTVDVKYKRALPDSDAQCAVAMQLELGSPMIREAEGTEVRCTLTNRRDEPLPMVLAVISLPGGFEPRREKLKELVSAGTIDCFEVSGRAVNIYLNGMHVSETRTFNIDVSAVVPGIFAGGASYACLYYTAESKVWVEELVCNIGPQQ